MEGLGGYASSDDEGPSAAAAGRAAAASNHAAAASSTPVQPAVSSSPAESAEEKAERKRTKQAKKEKKAAKAAAAASAVPPLSSLNAPLPTPKLALPSASSLLASGSTKGLPSFLAHAGAASTARAQETLEALLKEAEMMGGSGGAILRSEPRGILRDAAARAMEKQAAEERAERDRTKLLSSAAPHAGDKRAVPSAPALDDRAAKKPRAAGEGEGPARRNQDTMQKEKEKRAKGQSGVEGWKPEAWMKMRQDYD